MCDCYAHPCNGGCGSHIDMHLGDFDTGQDEVEVYCEFCWKLLDPKPKRWNAHLVNAEDMYGGDRWEDEKVKVGGLTMDTYVVVVHLTENAVYNREMNHPNRCWSTMLKDQEEPVLKEGEWTSTSS